MDPFTSTPTSSTDTSDNIKYAGDPTLLVHLDDLDQAKEPLENPDQYLYNPAQPLKPNRSYKYVVMLNSETQKPQLYIFPSTAEMTHARVAAGKPILSGGRLAFTANVTVSRSPENEDVFNLFETLLAKPAESIESYTIIRDENGEMKRVEVDRTKETSQGSIRAQAIKDKDINIKQKLDKQLTRGQIGIFDNTSTGYKPVWMHVDNAIALLSPEFPGLFNEKCIDFANKKMRPTHTRNNSWNSVRSFNPSDFTPPTPLSPLSPGTPLSAASSSYFLDKLSDLSLEEKFHGPAR